MRIARTLLATVPVVFLAAVSLTAQQRDYLTEDEVALVRDTQDAVPRVKLFFTFADQRLVEVEKLLGIPPAGSKDASQPVKPPSKVRPHHLQEALNNYIRAIDDAATNLEDFLERGGVDLRKLRKPMEESMRSFRARLQVIGARPELQQGTLRYDMEDAVEATQDLQALGEQIPDQPIPPKLPTVAGQPAGEQPAQPGRPTLKRKGEKKPPSH